MADKVGKGTLKLFALNSNQPLAEKLLSQRELN